MNAAGQRHGTPPAGAGTSHAFPIRLPPLLRLVQGREFRRKLGLCDRLFGRALAAHGTVWVRTAPGPVWKLDLTNQTHRWIVYGCYEGPAFWRWLAAHRSGIRTIVDSGANIGQTVLYFASMIPSARVLAYEPGSAARAWLAEGVAANRFPQVTVESAGLGTAAGPARLADGGGADRHGSWSRISPTDGEPIEIAALDEELERHGIDVLDLWKLDMEGYEDNALRGAARALAAGRIRTIHIEAVGEGGRASLEFLANHGYRPHGLTPAGRLAPWTPSNLYDNALCLAPGNGAAAR